MGEPIPQTCFPMHDLFQERILNSAEVCRNCFQTVRVERTRPTASRLNARVESSYYSREERNTTVEYAPAKTASESKGVFCTCGVESAFHRVWSDRTVTRERFRTFLKRVLRALSRQGIQIDRQRAAYHALYAFDSRGLNGDEHGPLEADIPSIDECLSAGIGHGLVADAVTPAAEPA